MRTCFSETDLSAVLAAPPVLSVRQAGEQVGVGARALSSPAAAADGPVGAGQGALPSRFHGAPPGRPR